MDDFASDVLVVDDTPENITLLRQMLSERGYRVRPALSGEIALKAVQAAIPDLILLDIMMPGMDGFEVCRVLKSEARTRDIPVLFVSALDEVVDKVKGFQVGGVDYVTKPFHSAEVLARVETHLKLRKAQIELEETLDRLRHAQKKLVQAERMAAIGTMAGGVAHELNNILSGVVSCPDLLLTQLAEGSDLRESIKVIRESGLRSAAVVADLLTLSRGGGYNTVMFDLNLLVDRFLQSEHADRLRRRHPEIAIDFLPAPDLCYTECSPMHLEKVILNLVTSAFGALRGTGRITLKTESRKIEKSRPGLHPPDLDPGNYIVFKVTDSAPAISRDDRDRIFEPFYAKKTMGRGGSGLELAVVWRIAEEHRGAVTVESGDEGNSFLVYLPAVDAGRPEMEKIPPADSLEGSGSILVVDDEPLLRKIASRMLSHLGYRVATVSSGEEAVAHLRGESADLVLLDMVTPAGMGGYETYLAIAAAEPRQSRGRGW